MAAGVTRATWADIESGKRANVRVRTLDSIDRALRLTPGTLSSLSGVTVTDLPGQERRIIVLLEAKAGDTPSDVSAREQLVHYATTLSNYDVQRVLTFIDRMPPPPDIDRYVREAVERTLVELLSADGKLGTALSQAAPAATATKTAHRKVS